MRVVAISSFDSGMFRYAVRMYDSLAAFCPVARLVCGDMGLSRAQRRHLKGMGVDILETDRRRLLGPGGIGLTFSDFLTASFLRDIQWDRVLWMDVDSMALGDMSELLSIDADFIGHPGRSRQGPIRTFRQAQRYIHPETKAWLAKNMPYSRNTPYFAGGTWCTRSREFLDFLDGLLDRMPTSLPAASPVIGASVNHLGLSRHRLQADVWNFGRDLVRHARYRGGRIFYGDIEPKVVAFSRKDDGSREESSDITRFYRKAVRGSANRK